MWRWPRRGPNGDREHLAEQQARLKAAERMTPLYERLAEHLAELPPEELATRLRAALTLRTR